MFQNCVSEKMRLEEEVPLITHLGSQVSEHLWSSLVQEEESHPSLQDPESLSKELTT